MMDLGNISYYLRMKVDDDLNKKIIALQQSIYFKKILRQYKKKNCRPAKISISPGIVNFFTSYKNQANKSIIA